MIPCSSVMRLPTRTLYSLCDRITDQAREARQKDTRRAKRAKKIPGARSAPKRYQAREARQKDTRRAKRAKKIPGARSAPKRYCANQSRAEGYQAQSP